MEHFEAVMPMGPAWMVMGSNAPTPPATFVPCNTGKYLISPLGSTLAFLGYGPTSGAAQSNAINLFNLTGSAQNVLAVTWGPPADAPRVFTLGCSPNPPPGTSALGPSSTVMGMFFCALTATGSPTAPIVIIPADGM